MKLYAITDSRLFAGDRQQRWARLTQQVLAWVNAGVDFIQIREKHLDGPDLRLLAAQLRESVFQRARAKKLTAPRVLLNAANETQWRIAYTAGLHGIHLPSDAHPLAARMSAVCDIWLGGRSGERAPIISIACHTIDEVYEARALGASVIVFAPVFEKPIREAPAPEHIAQAPILPCTDGASEALFLPAFKAALPGTGLSMLQAACEAAAPVPVFALGGITAENAAACVMAGAAGVAGVRLFAGGDWRRLVKHL